MSNRYDGLLRGGGRLCAGVAGLVICLTGCWAEAGSGTPAASDAAASPTPTAAPTALPTLPVEATQEPVLAPSGRRLATLEGHFSHVDTVAWAPDGRRLATAGWDKVIIIWDMTPR